MNNKATQQDKSDRSHYIDFRLATHGTVNADDIMMFYNVCRMTALRDIKAYKLINYDIGTIKHRTVVAEGFKSVYGYKIEPFNELS